jgi:hypothetical protein
LVHLEISLPFASRFPTWFLLLPLSGKTGEIFSGNMEKGGGSSEKLLKVDLGQCGYEAALQSICGQWR